MKARVVQIKQDYGSLVAEKGGVGLRFLPGAVSGDVDFDDLKGRRVTYELGTDDTGRQIAIAVKVM